MSREIQLRAWDKYNRCWIYLRLQDFCITSSSAPNQIIWSNYESWCQYTGLKDKNGKDLDWWEGDILKKDNGCLAEIIFRNGCFMGKWIGRDEIPLFYFNQDEQHPEWFEIIGDIHTTPELMEKQ